MLNLLNELIVVMVNHSPRIEKVLVRMDFRMVSWPYAFGGIGVETIKISERRVDQ